MSTALIVLWVAGINPPPAQADSEGKPVEMKCIQNLAEAKRQGAKSAGARCSPSGCPRPWEFAPFDKIRSYSQ